MKLNFERLGEGFPLIILHGLYGSGSNWLTIAKELSGMAQVYLVDQRNHGQSDHSDRHDYSVMAEDLIEFMDEQEISKAVVLGHSMGGKVAVHAAVNNPERIARLIVADISPLPYQADHDSRNHMGGHKKIIDHLLSIDLSQFSTLKAIDQALADFFPEKPLRQFLMKNLAKDQDGKYYWQINLQALLKNLNQMADGIQVDSIPMEGFRQYPVLFIRGDQSHYIQKEDERAIKRIFPLSNIVTLKGAGHWLHAEQPEVFVKTVKQFLLEY